MILWKPVAPSVAGFWHDGCRRDRLIPRNWRRARSGRRRPTPAPGLPRTARSSPSVSTPRSTRRGQSSGLVTRSCTGLDGRPAIGSRAERNLRRSPRVPTGCLLARHRASVDGLIDTETRGRRQITGDIQCPPEGWRMQVARALSTSSLRGWIGGMGRGAAASTGGGPGGPENVRGALRVRIRVASDTARYQERASIAQETGPDRRFRRGSVLLSQD